MEPSDYKPLSSDYRLLSKLQRLIRSSSYSRRLRLRNLMTCNTYPLYNGAQSKHDVMLAINEHADGQKNSTYIGLGMCENVWACPRCAPLKIAEYRDKITAIINHWRERGYVAHMVTFTIPHYIEQSADEVFTNLRQTYKKFLLNNIAHWRRAVGSPGTIDATECKYNYFNGWHFHKHVLFFMPAEHSDTFTSDEFEQNWRAKWQKLFTPLLKRNTSQVGLKISKSVIRDGGYVAKELAKTRSSHATAGRRKTLDVWDLLESDNPRENDLYLEYCEAIYRRSRIHIGRKLSKGVDFDDVKKNKPSGNPIISTTVVATFTFDEWRYIIDDELETEIPHRANILDAALEDYFNGAFFYCLQHALPLPHEPDGYATTIDYTLLTKAAAQP